MQNFSSTDHRAAAAALAGEAVRALEARRKAKPRMGLIEKMDEKAWAAYDERIWDLTVAQH